MFNSSTTSEIYASAEDRISPFAPPYPVDEKTTTPDEPKCVEKDYLWEIGQEKGTNGSSQTSWARHTQKQRASLEPVRGEISRRQSENKCSPGNWRPTTLQYPALLSFAIISLSLIAILEVLHHYTKGDNGGGLAFAATPDQLSTIASFSYLYLPTILAVLYSMLWNWIDLDAKRFEPWFQLSKLHGANAEDSLLLHYPFEFLAFVPIRALRRRHWAVFYAGLATMVIFWAITPLQSAIFNIGTVSRTQQSQMITTGSVIPMSSQTTALNANFMNTAYGVAWLGQKLPAYTTADYALEPFAPVNYNPNALSTETWSASTLAYGTKLACKPANVSFNSATTAYAFDNGAGCTTQEFVLPRATDNGETFMALYIQYWDNAEADWALQGPNCSIEHSHNFLALAASVGPEAPQLQGGEYSNLTALFCQPSYFKLGVTADVNGTDQSVFSSNFSIDSTEIDDLPENFFNVTNFEYIIGTGISPTNTRQDYQNTVVLQQYPRVFQYRLTFPVSNMVGFAVAANAASNNSVQNLSDPTVLQDAFEKAHKLLFSTAITALTQFSSSDASNETRDGLVYDNRAAITYTREFAIIVEVSLSVVAFLICALWYYSFRRPSKLTSDPAASIADVMSLVCHSKDLSYLFQDDGTVTEEMLKHRLRHKRFLLSPSSNGQNMRLNVHDSGSSAETDDQARKIQRESKNTKPRSSKMVRPVEMGLITGAALVSLILGPICFLTVFYMRITTENGLARPSTNTLVLSFLENALPTAFASILEPLWVVLNRLLCVLRPFEDLRIGNASPSRTIRVQYTSLPPQLVFLRALRSRHLILATVCAVAVSSNILAVSLGALFNEAPTSTVTTMILPQIFATTFNGSSDITEGNIKSPNAYLDHFYVTLSNLTDGTSLPPWVDYNMFYLPFEIPSVPDQLAFASSQGGSQLQTLAGPVHGFGVVTNCWSGGTSMANRTVLFDFVDSGSNGSTITVSVSQSGGNGNTTTLDQGTVFFESIPDSAAASEVVLTLVNNTLLVLGWARIGPAVSNNSLTAKNMTNNRSFEYTSMFCSPQLITAEYDVVVDLDGHILSANQTTLFDQNTNIYSTTKETSHFLSKFNELIGPLPSKLWHNDLFTSDWTNSILKAYMNSTDFIDASKPLPDINAVIPVVEGAYQRLSAIILGLTPNVFLPAPSTDTVITSVSISETRIFMSPLMFEISIAVLSLHLLTVILYYARRPKRFLPRMPTTIANIFAFVSMSHAVEDVSSMASTPQHEARYGYGRFLGMDGKPHVGIERSSRIVPLQSVNLGARRQRWNIRTWLRNRKDQQTWI